MGHSSLDSPHIHIYSKMKMFVVLALVAAAAAEPEADPALVYTTGLHAAPLTYAAGLPLAHHTYAGVPVVGVKSAVVKSVVEKPADVKVATTPVVYSAAVHHPVVYNTAVHTPVVYNTAAAVHKPVVYNAAVAPIANYNNPEQYTAVSNGVFGPSYVAKNGPVEHVVKREAEAEADPALLYSTYGYPTYAGVYGAGVYGLHHAGVYGLHHAGVYAAAPTVVANPLVKTPDHAVALTAAGYTHSSNVGVCTNVNGVQVPC